MQHETLINANLRIVFLGKLSTKTELHCVNTLPNVNRRFL